MRTLYLECGMGAAGDMLTAALLELTGDREAFLNRMNALGLPGVRVEAEPMTRCGIVGTHIKVTVHGEEEESLDTMDEADHGYLQGHGPSHFHGDEHEHGHFHTEGAVHEHEHFHDGKQEHDPGYEHGHDHGEHGHHHHAALTDIEAVIDRLDISERVRKDAKEVYHLIAEAESHAHGRPVHEIHFHEVGTLDAVADVVAVCLLMEQLNPDQVAASPVHVGAGYVRCMHGTLPVPAPATAWILKDVPTYGGQVQGELCTPTGAALLKHFVTRFGDRPVMRVRGIGYGMGKKDFERANCVRAFWGETEGELELVTKLECNLDDMTGEDIAYAMEQLFQCGAREVFTQAVGMKKSRPGILLSVLCAREDADRMAEAVMKHTTTLGIRRMDMSRYALERRIEPVSTPCGEIRVKFASGMGVERSKPEFEDLAALAREKGVSIAQIRKEIKL